MKGNTSFTDEITEANGSQFFMIKFNSVYGITEK